MNTPVFIFDIGNVLVDFDLNALLQLMADEADRPIEDLYAAWNDSDQQKVESGLISGEEYFTARIQSIIPHWSLEDWIQIWVDIFTLNLNGRELFLDLHANGYPVYVLSNLADYNKTALDRKFPHLFDLCTDIFLSYEMGLIKPDPAIYRTVIDRIGTAPENCFFMDDSAENIDAAIEAGMQGVVVCKDQFDLVLDTVERFLENKGR